MYKLVVPEHFSVDKAGHPDFGTDLHLETVH
jgi:hypothetical protein